MSLWSVAAATSLDCRWADGRLEEDCLPIGQIYCMGQNYPLHAQEMGIDPAKTPPVFFCKGQGCLMRVRDKSHLLPLPPCSDDIQPEVELVVVLRAGGFQLTTNQAEDAIFGFGVGLDMTRRDMQRAARPLGLPWDMAKHFPHAAPVGIITEQSSLPKERDGIIQLSINGVVRQKDQLRHRIWKTAIAIAIVSRYQTLRAGDMIFTGTPSGVAAVQKGDSIHASVEGLDDMTLQCV